MTADAAPAADRDDTAMIEQAREVATAAVGKFFQHYYGDGAGHRCEFCATIASLAVEAAAGVLVPATAEPPKLLPAESMAVTVARGMIQRGVNPEINVTAFLLMIIERLTTAGLSAGAATDKEATSE